MTNGNFLLQKLKSVLWYTERVLTDVSLGGLLVLVVIRTIQYNMLKMRDKYLHTNCLAALANMSSQFRNLHPYVSQRLVSLFETLARRFQRLRARFESQRMAEVAVTVAEDGTDMEQDISVLEEVLRMVLEIFNSCLSNQLVNNPNLVYTLLYNKHIFEAFKDNLVFQDVVQNIDVVINYFSDLLSSKSQHYEVDAQEVLSIIQQNAKYWPKDRIKVMVSFVYCHNLISAFRNFLTSSLNMWKRTSRRSFLFHMCGLWCANIPLYIGAQTVPIC